MTVMHLKAEIEANLSIALAGRLPACLLAKSQFSLSNGSQ
jgi:hypothetical protein